ncbi:hypothetical protein XAC3810_90095 [Xanthomonas citri pv. citri]|uniref:Uncharacterized protein n=1 Tax=Xanthomonas citri pv. citri TaxID=611301 RepID=A0A0U5BW63_XANCI|nr:hypothetical protein XAC3824_110096 [Xanthomonas citri pv. citri]CEE16530.1 hypothetical protein XAC1083_100095 [Xanthomonas citri pv. citri]CEE17397.1 hypothetical protein XAC902_100096 [Xanthomonas citri pv. citri]CEE27030.1 hypothetical protein XAC908_140032 [Xanthomonas citri pv. citri]CEE42602.1 hypothetical protein XAC9322_80095 [Xanthomonas citri pv. citri]
MQRTGHAGNVPAELVASTTRVLRYGSHRRQRIALRIVHAHPIGVGQRVQAMRQARFIALRTALPEFQRGRHGRAGRRAAVVDAAAAVATDVCVQRDTTRLRLRGAAHRPLMRA